MQHNTKLDLSLPQEMAMSNSEITVRHGDALPPNIPNAIDILGSLTAPLDYYRQRSALEQIDKTKCLVTYKRDEQEANVVFHEDPTNRYAAQIKGILKLNPELALWGINTDKARSVKELAAFLRLKRRFFTDGDTHTNLLKSLQNFSMKVSTDVVDKNDRRGVVEAKIAQEVKDHNVLEHFTLEMPLFLGTDAKRFKVTIEFDQRDAGLSIYLLSEELLELKDALVTNEIEKVTAGFEGCAVLEVV
jgi:hypothetical protein